MGAKEPAELPVSTDEKQQEQSLKEAHLYSRKQDGGTPSRMNWHPIIWVMLGVLVTMILTNYSQVILGASPKEHITEDKPGVILSPSSTPSETPSATPTARAGTFTFLEPTITPTPVPNGQVVIFKPQSGNVGWVISETDDDIDNRFTPSPNYFDDSFLYAGTRDEKIYHGAIQFDLSIIPPGSKIYAASMQLTGLQAEHLNEGGNGLWYLQLLSTEIDFQWQGHGYDQIHNAVIWSTLAPPLSQEQLGEGWTNTFEFSPAQLILLERRLLEGDGKVSFRLDGPMMGNDDLFAWDTGQGPVTNGAGPELFISVGPPPTEAPPPYYVLITSTPTPENISTAVAISLQVTAEATRVGTVTPLPPNWVTPIMVTRTPTPENEATRQAVSELATAIALTTGQPPNVSIPTASPTYLMITSTPTPESVLTAAAISRQLTAEADQFGTATPLPRNWVTPIVVTALPTPENKTTAQAMNELATAVALTTGQLPNVATETPTPTYVVITSTPTPESILTAAAISRQLTAEAEKFGTATPLPTNWVTPIVVTDIPTPANTATVEYLQAVMLVTGTPTATPGNVQTATPTMIFIPIDPLLSPTPTMTPLPTPQPIPDVLIGKVAFLSDREGTPQPYIYDPEDGQLGRLTDIWPYEVAATRDAWSADTTYEAYNKQLLWTNTRVTVGSGSTINLPTTVFALHFYDYKYKVERQITFFGTGWVWDPAWSPTAEQIAFVSNDSADDEIWVINRDGSNLQQLTSSNEIYNAREIGKDTFIPEINGHPSWSPDGQKIVFFSNRTGKNQIWIMNKDGSEQRLLMDWNPYSDWHPVWIKYPDPAPLLEKVPDWRFRKPP